MLNSLIMNYLRIQSSRSTRVAAEDLEDIAAQKSLDLLCKSEQGEWDPSGRNPGEIVSFLTAVARNGLVDFLRRNRHLVMSDPADDPVWATHQALPTGMASSGALPSHQVERREYVKALRDCVSGLQPRAQQVWFYRVFLEMPSKEIASHPEVKLNAGNVDVILQRTREVVRDCMIRKGYDPQDMPPGTFSELWRLWYAEPVSSSDARAGHS